MHSLIFFLTLNCVDSKAVVFLEPLSKSSRTSMQSTSSKGSSSHLTISTDFFDMTPVDATAGFFLVKTDEAVLTEGPPGTSLLSGSAWPDGPDGPDGPDVL